MAKFIDRISERATLEEAWAAGKPELIVLHGRRRVGKSALLARFARNRPVAYYVAAQQLERDQLADLGRSLGPLSTGFRAGRPPRLAFGDWDELLSVVVEASQHRRIGLILDEFPYLAQATSALPSLIQRWWDAAGSHANLVLILAGSQQAMMQRLVAADGALYGRPTRHMEIHPFDYYHAAKFAPGWSAEDRVRLYAVAGGIPDYLEEIDPASPIKDEILRLAFSPAGRLFREAPDLLRAEFNEPRTYESIVRAIAQGAVTPAQVADRAGLAGANRVAPYLERLTELGLVERRVPPVQANVPKPRISQYVIADQYLRFYYAIVDPWRSSIQLGQGSVVLDELWSERFDHFVSRSFEDVCRQYVRRLIGAGRIAPIASVGFWWFPGGDIDVAGVTGRRLALAGSAKWTKEHMKAADLDGLRHAAATVAPGDRPRLMLFARSGFDRNLLRESQATLVRLPDLFAKDLEYEGGG
jgi:uncharacterized protein